MKKENPFWPYLDRTQLFYAMLDINGDLFLLQRFGFCAFFSNPAYILLYSTAANGIGLGLRPIYMVIFLLL